MKGFQCQFTGGEIAVSCKRKLSSIRWQWRGNGIRGALLAGALVLLILRAWELGLALLLLALSWCAGEIAWRERKQIMHRQKALAALKRGDLDTAASLLSPEPGDDASLCLAGAAMEQGRWELAHLRLEPVQEEEPYRYLMALAEIGLNRPEQAMKLCDSAAEPRWLMLRAQCFYRLRRWQELLTLLARQRRLRERHPDPEWDFLRGAAYYQLGQFKPAIRVLKRCNQYPLAARWIKKIEEGVKR